MCVHLTRETENTRKGSFIDAPEFAKYCLDAKIAKVYQISNSLKMSFLRELRVYRGIHEKITETKNNFFL